MYSHIFRFREKFVVRNQGLALVKAAVRNFFGSKLSKINIWAST